VIPVIIGVTGTITKSLTQYLSNIPGKHEIKELQKTTILASAHTHTHTLWKVLM
jgi:type I site-specific restriction endonuclease